MKKQSLFTKIIEFFGKKEKKESSVSVLSRKIIRQGYKAKHLGTAVRKKSIREKWQTRKEGRGQQKTGIDIDGDSGKERNLFKVVLLAGGFLLGGYFLTIGPLQVLLGDLLYFRIHEIEISGCVVTTPQTLKKFAYLTYEMNMLTLQPGAVKERLEMHPWIEQAKIRRIWPDGLLVSIKEYRPQALIVQEDEKGFQYLDSRGNLFAAVASGQDLDFPVITGLDVFGTGLEKKQLLASAATFLRLASQNNPSLPAQNISEIHFTTEGDLIVYLVEHPFPMYIGKGDIKRKFSQLHRVLKVLYQKKKGKAIIEDVAFIRMDYQKDKVLVVRNHSG